MNYWIVPTLILASVLFGAGVGASRRTPQGAGSIWLICIGILASIPGVVFTSYYLRIFDEPIWLYQFRSLPCTELAASGAGFLAGLLQGRYASALRFRRIAGRWMIPALLLLGLFIPYAKPVFRPPQRVGYLDRWSEGVCLQTSESSCGPACAATLLRKLGKPGTEKEIAEECFTSGTGTENWFLARALRRRGSNVRFVFSPDPPWPMQAIAGVRLPNARDAGHFIALLGREGDKWVIGDPLEGRLIFSEAALRKNYTFTGFFMKIE